MNTAAPPPPADESCLVELARLDDATALAEAAGERWLTPAEASRVDAMASEIRRRQFLAGHWLVRRLAAQRFGGDPAEWRFEAGVGVPARVFADAIQAWVSISHSGGWIAAAIAMAPVGLDLEFPRKPRDLLALAGFVFSPEECAHLASLPEAGRSETFHAYWTLKEARGKRGGEGLQPSQARRVTARSCPAAEAEARHWPLPEEGSLALAAWPGATVRAIGFDPESAPSWWRYVAVAD